MPDTANKKESKFKLLAFDRPDLVAITICVLVFFFWLNLLIDKFIHFGYYDWDLAIYANAMWALTHGSFSGSLWGVNFLTNHAEYISLLLIPLYWLFPSAFTLVTLKLLSLVVGGYVFYRIGKEKVGWLLSLVLMLLYFTFPANFFMLIFEFHFESLAIVFLFLAYYYLHTRANLRNFILFCILGSLCKENISPVIFMFGFMSLFQKGKTDRKFAYSAMAIGAGTFIIAMFIVTPLLRHYEGQSIIVNPYIGLYWADHEKLSLIQNLSINASRLFSLLFSSWNILYAKEIFLPFFMIPLMGFNTLLVATPLILQALLSNTYSMHTIYFHYAATLAPFLFLATLEGFAWLLNKFSKLTVFVLTALFLVGQLANTYHQTSNLIYRISQWSDTDDPARAALIEQIPSNASVVSTFEFLSPLANRDHIYPLRNIWNNLNIFKSSCAFIVPQTQYALIDFNCPWLWSEVLTSSKQEAQKKLRRLCDFYFNGNWQVKAAIGDIILLEKKHGNLSDQKSLAAVQKIPFSTAIINPGKKVAVDQKFQLLTSEIGQNSFRDLNKPLTALTFYWKADQKISDSYIVNIALLNKNRIIKMWYHPIGYAVYPTALWEQGDYIKETYWLDTASLPAGKYSFVIAIKNSTQNRWEDLEYQNKKLQQISIATMTVK